MRPSRLRLGGLLALLVLTLAGYAWYSGQRLLAQQGITRLDWQGLALSASGPRLARLELEQRSPAGALRVQAEQLTFAWRATTAPRLHLQRLELDWQAADAPKTSPSAPTDPNAWLDALTWLPRSLRIEQLSAQLPCAAGRCRLEGALGLRHGGAQLLPIDLELDLQRQAQQAQLRVQLSGSRAAARLDLRVLLEGQARLTLLASLDSSASETLWTGQIAVPSLPDAPWPSAWLGEWLVPPGQPLPAAPEGLQLTGDWRLRLPPGPLQPALLDQAEGHLNLSAHLPTPWPLPSLGQVQGDLALQLRTQQGQVQGDLRLSQAQATFLQLSGLEAELHLSGQLDDSGIALTLGPDSGFSLGHARSPELRLDQLHGNLSGLRLQGRFAETGENDLRLQGPVELSVKNLGHARLKPQAWRWQGQLEADPKRIRLQGALTGDSGLALDLALLRTDNGALSLTARMQEIFLRIGNPLTKTLADWPALLSLNSGRLRADADLQLAPATASPRLGLNLDLQGLTGIYDRTLLDGLEARLQVLLKGGQLQLKVPALSLKQVNPGIALGPLHLQGDYAAGLDRPLQGRLALRQADSGFLGGMLRLEPANWDLAQEGLLLPLQLQGLELEQLFRAYPTEGLAGQGTLDGRLPLRISATGLSIQQGQLAARAPGGILQFHSERIRALGRSNPSMQLVTQALEDFHYQRLSSTVDYDEQGKLHLGLRLEGRNPALENGRPIHFSIALEEHIPTLLASLQLTDKVSDLIKQRVQERLRQRPATP